MIGIQRRCGWVATTLLAIAACGFWSRPVAAQSMGNSGSSSGSGFSGSSSGSGFTGSSSGSGFTGSSSGSGFTGSSTGTGFSGTSTGTSTGTTNRTGSSRTGSATGQVVPQASDPFQAYYANPYKFGVSTGTTGGTQTTQATFGQPLYGTITTSTTGRTTGTGSTSGSSSGFTTVGMSRAPAYTTILAFAPPAPPVPGVLQTKLSGVLAGSSMLTSGTIEVVVAGPTVILRGNVASDNERRLAEGMVRLEPGVRDVRNELRVPTAQGRLTP